jgi:hypothetical protein
VEAGTQKEQVLLLTVVDLQLFLQLLNGHTEHRLRDMSGISPPAKVLFAGYGDDVFEFDQRHGVIVMLFTSSDAGHVC